MGYQCPIEEEDTCGLSPSQKPLDSSLVHVSVLLLG